MSGSAYAASKITGAQIKDGTITGKEIKRGSISPSNLSSSAKDGMEGPIGDTGPAGPAGAPGAPGMSGLVTVESAHFSIPPGGSSPNVTAYFQAICASTGGAVASSVTRSSPGY